MKPKFKTRRAWSQAEQLLQPAFIRIIDNFRAQLENTPWLSEYEEVQSPYPGYVLHLKRDELEQEINVWDLCYQICFEAYPTDEIMGDSCAVEIDQSLIDASGVVDWQQLERKTQRLVQAILEPLITEH